MHFFDFVFSSSFGHHQNSHENHGAAPGHHFKIRALRYTLNLEEDPGVSEYLSEYVLFCQSA
jgi:hypothetical protein